MAHQCCSCVDCILQIKIVKSNVSIARNYLSEKEMRSLERIVSAYLDLAEDRAERHIPMTMEDWSKLKLNLKNIVPCGERGSVD